MKISKHFPNDILLVRFFGFSLVIVKCQPAHPTHLQNIKIHPFLQYRVSTFQILIIEYNLEITPILKCMNVQISKLIIFLTCVASAHFLRN